MLRITSILLLFVSSHLSATQNIDSLWSVWQNEKIPDTTRLRTLYKVTTYLQNSNLDSSIKVGELGIAFAQQTNQNRFLIYFLNYLIAQVFLFHILK